MMTDHNESNAFEASVIRIIKEILERRGVSAAVDSETDIFVDRLIDSVSFAELLSTLELEMDIEVPDHKLSTEFFRTPSTIARTFGRVSD